MAGEVIPSDSEASLDLRPAEVDDFAFAYDLTRGNMEAYVARHFGGWRDDIFAENYQKGLNYILWVDGIRVGYVRWRVESPMLFLDDLQIAPSHQGRGLGTRILAYLETLLSAVECQTIRLRVYHENPARRLYMRFGFREVERNEATSYLQRGA